MKELYNKRIDNCIMFRLFIVGLSLLLTLTCTSVAEVIDDFEDGVIAPELWSLGVGNYGGQVGLGEITESDGQLLFESSDSQPAGGGVCGAILRQPFLDIRIPFSFELTLFDDHLNGEYVQILSFWVIDQNIYSGVPGPDGNKSMVYGISHDQKQNTNQINGSYYFYIDSVAKEARLYDLSDDSLLGSVSYSHFGSNVPYICFIAYTDTQDGSVRTTFKLNEIVTSDGTGTLSGSVSDSITEQPISNAKVIVVNQSTTMTDQSGIFQLDNLMLGDAKVYIHKTGYSTATELVNISYSLNSLNTALSPIDLTDPVINHYDKNNRLVGQEHSSEFSIGYKYDGNGNMVRKVRLDEDVNGDDVPDILQFINDVPLTEPMDKSVDSDNDGWTDWQELLAGSDLLAEKEFPSQSGAYGESLAYVDEQGVEQEGFQLLFKPTRWVMATGDLDGKLGDEVVIGADGDTGEKENFVWVLTQDVQGWTSKKVLVGDSAVTSIVIGAPNDLGNSVFVGLRNYVQGGSVIKLDNSENILTTETLLTSKSADAYVYGVRSQQGVVVCCGFDSRSEYSIYKISQKNNWQPEFETAVEGMPVAGTVFDKKYGIYDDSGSTVSLDDQGNIKITNVPDAGIIEEDLIAYFPFSGNVYDYSENHNDPKVTGTGTSFVPSRSGDPNTAIHFEGNDLLEIIEGKDISFDASQDEYTICFWLCPDDNTIGTIAYDLAGTDKGYEGYSYKIFLDNEGKINAGIWDAAFDFNIKSTTILSNGQWHHIAFIVRNNIGRLYIDGQMEDWSKTGQCSTKTTGGVQIGDSYSGSLDELRFYSRGLYKTEINYLYDGSVHTQEITLSENNEKIIFGNPFTVESLRHLEEEEVTLGNFQRLVTQQIPLPTDPNYISIHPDIQSAINAAQEGDIIIVDDGTYGPITIDKYLTIQSKHGRDLTIIDGANSQRCVMMNTSSEIIGVTIQNGRLNAGNRGAGVYMDNGGLLDNCVIQNCEIVGYAHDSYENYGGGIYSSNGGVFQNCIIKNNRVEGSISREYSGVAMYGGGICAAFSRVYNCSIEQNELYGYSVDFPSAVNAFGAGIYSNGESFVENCIIDNNTILSCGPYSSDAWGGGVYGCYLVNSILAGNHISAGYSHIGRAYALGAGAANSQLSNCIVIDNTSKARSETTNLQSCAGVYNSSIKNSIIYNNQIVEGGCSDDLAEYYNCLLSNNGMVLQGVDCIYDESPEFVMYTNDGIFNDDFHLRESSPCIDAGNNDYVTTCCDLEGNNRTQGLAVDIGPYEYGAVSYENQNIVPNYSSLLYFSCIDDKNDSGTVDPGDDFILSSYQLGDQTVSSGQEFRVSLDIVSSETYALCSFEDNNIPLLFTAEPDGKIYQWSYDEDAISRKLFSASHHSQQWYGLSELGTYYDSRELIGVASAQGNSDLGKIITWDISEQYENENLTDANVYQSPPEVEILTSIVSGGAVAKINLIIADNEYNQTIPILQYRTSPTSQWQTATINTLNGEPFSDDPHVETQPDGQPCQIIWDTVSDLGDTFSGQVEIRIIARDVSETSLASNVVGYYVDTTDLVNYPQLSITSGPESVSYETTAADIAGSAVNITGDMHLHNTRNDFQQNISASSNWQFIGIQLEPGDNPIVISGSNSDGFTTSLVKNIWRSRGNAPTISIDPVESNLTGRYHSLTGLCNEHTVQVILENITTGYSVVVQAHPSWTSPLLEFALGTNLIQATALNVSGEYDIAEIFIDTENCVWYVDMENTGSGHTGSSQNPFIAIQEAINVALPSDEICVALGEYPENLTITSDVKLSGGFDGQEWEQKRFLIQKKTLLVGQLGSVLVIENANAEIEGFAISGGNNVSAGAGINYTSSGGTPRNLNISNCLIENNIISDIGNSIYGAGIYCQGNVAVNLQDNTIANNLITSDTANLIQGGGIYCDTLGPNILKNNLVADNHIIINSSGDASAAGVYVVSSDIINNTIVNNTISGAEATISGGGAVIDSISRIENSIIWDNFPDQIVGHDCERISYSDIQEDICLDVNGNISSDPLFVDKESQNYHLQSLGGHWDNMYDASGLITWITDYQTSPGIDAGDPNLSYSAETFPHGRRINMGVYGGTEQASRTYLTSTISEDFDNSQVVDVNDLTILASHWLDIEYELEIYDLNDDGVINLIDLSYLSEQWRHKIYKLVINIVGQGIIIPANGYYPPETIVRLSTDGNLKSWQGTDDDSVELSENKVAMTSDRTVTIEHDEFFSWVFIDDDPGVLGHERFTGYISKYETTNSQYCDFLNSALASGDITVRPDNIVYGANGSNGGADFKDLNYFNTYDASPESQIIYSGGAFSVRSRDGYDMGNHPVIEMSWYGATAFCNYYGYRLPTEWEWQAVADYEGSYIYGCGTTIDQSIANYYDNDDGPANPLGLSSPYTSPVGYYGADGYGLCDLAGNVWEWTSTVDGIYHIIKGGGWTNGFSDCNVSISGIRNTDIPSLGLGFRPVRETDYTLIDDFEDGVINTDLWSIALGNRGGGNALGTVSESGGQFTLDSYDGQAAGGGISGALLRGTYIDSKINFSFDLTLEDYDLNPIYVQMFRFVVTDQDTYGFPGPDGLKAYVYDIQHDPQQNTNNISGSYYFYFDSQAKEARLYDAADDSLLGSASYAHFGENFPHIAFVAYTDAVGDYVRITFKLDEISVDLSN